MASITAARRAPRCFGGEEGEETGWEYLCKWEGDWEDSWVRHDEMGTAEAMRRDMERARRRRRVAATFREWLEAEARRRERSAGLGKKKDSKGQCA